MNCQTIQNHVLALPDPRQLPGNLRDHFDACPVCLGWWKQVVRLECLVEQLPAPPAPGDRKAAFIDDLTAAGPVIRSIPLLDRCRGRSPLAAVFASSTARYAVALAASVLLALGGWLLVRPTRGPETAQLPAPKHPLLEKIVQRNLTLSQTKTPAQRLEVLGGLADDLSAEARKLARVANTDELRDLSGWYQKVVDEGILVEARKMPLGMNPTEKKALFDRLSARLAETKQEADNVVGSAPPHAQPALKTISDTAREGQAKLREILASEEA